MLLTLAWHLRRADASAGNSKFGASRLCERPVTSVPRSGLGLEVRWPMVSESSEGTVQERWAPTNKRQTSSVEQPCWGLRQSTSKLCKITAASFGFLSLSPGNPVLSMLLVLPGFGLFLPVLFKQEVWGTVSKNGHFKKPFTELCALVSVLCCDQSHYRDLFFTRWFLPAHTAPQQTLLEEHGPPHVLPLSSSSKARLASDFGLLVGPTAFIGFALYLFARTCRVFLGTSSEVISLGSVTERSRAAFSM